MKYDMAAATQIWDTWAPYIELPEGHHLAGGLARDFVIATLCKPSNTQKLAKEAAKALVDNLLGAITIQAFIDHTIPDDMDDEEEEENEVTTSLPPSPLPKRACGLLNNLPPVPVSSIGLISRGQRSPLGLTPQNPPGKGILTSQVDSSNTLATSEGNLTVEQSPTLPCLTPPEGMPRYTEACATHPTHGSNYCPTPGPLFRSPRLSS